MNEPAFPVPMIPIDREGGHTEVRCLGMSMRDYFAAAALTQIIADAPAKDAWSKIAFRAYELADAMLAERAKIPS
jgi:hypothetical protein